MPESFYLNNIEFFRVSDREAFYARIPTPDGWREINTGIASREEIQRNLDVNAIAAVIGNTPSANLTSRIIAEIARREIKLVDAIDQFIENKERLAGVTVSTARTYKKMLFWVFSGLLARNANALVSDIRMEDIDEYINGESHRRLETRRLALRVSRMFCHWAVEEGFMTRNPTVFLRIRERNLPVKLRARYYRAPWNDDMTPLVFRALEMENLRLLEQAQKAHQKYHYGHRAKYLTRCHELRRRASMMLEMKLILMLCRYLGLRISDAVSVEWVSVLPGPINNNGEFYIIFSRKRNRQVRIVPPQFLRNMVNEWYKHPDRDEVYLTPVARDVFFNNRKQFAKIMQRIFKKYNVRSPSVFHGMRVAFAVDCVRAGMPLEEVSRLLAHAKPQTTAEHYAHAGLISRTPYDSDLSGINPAAPQPPPPPRVHPLPLPAPVFPHDALPRADGQAAQ